MENIFVNTDWHLYNSDPNPHHPYRTRTELEKLKDNIGNGMTEADLWIFLGDLCDPEAVKDDTMIRQILANIPATKVLVLGNRDIADERWYKDLGFDKVTKCLTIHNMVFTHRPQPVPKDWINIHGDLHFQKYSMDGNHINVYAKNWDDACHALNLDDLLKRAGEEISQPKNKPFEAPSEVEPLGIFDTLDLTDQFTLYPVDETYSKYNGKIKLPWNSPEELSNWMHKNIKYDPEEKNWKLRDPKQVMNECKGNCHDQAYFEKKYLDLMGYETIMLFMIEYSGQIIQNAGKTHTLTAYRTKDDHKLVWFENAWGDESGLNGPYNSVSELKNAVKHAWNHNPKYPKLYIDYAVPVTHYGMDLEEYVEWNLPAKLLGESVDILDEVLFKDVEDTKYFEADDNEYKDKAEKAAVNQKNDSAVTLDESIIDRMINERHNSINELETIMHEAANQSDFDSNHKQGYKLNLSDFKRVYITKDNLQKYKDKKGMSMLRYVRPCEECTKSVGWVDDDDNLIAVVSVTYPGGRYKIDGDYNWISSLEVRKTYRGHNLGKQVLDYAVKKLGGDALGVSASNKVAQDMYEKYGFKVSKDSKRAVETKHSHHYMMYLNEDPGLDVELSESAHSESMSYSSEKKMINGVPVKDEEKATYQKNNQKPVKVEVDHLDEATVQFRRGAGGDDQVRIAGKMGVKTPSGLGYYSFDATLMAKDALYNQIKIAPQLIERERIASAQNMRDIAKYLNEQLSRVDYIKKAYPQLSAYELMPTTASMFYASMAEYEDGRIISKSRVEKFLDLLPDLDSDEFKEYINAVLMFLDHQKEALTQAVNVMVKAAGATIAQGNLLLSDDPKAILAGYEALHLDQYCSDDNGTLTFNYEPIGRGTVIVGKQCAHKHMYRRRENLAVKSFIKSLNYDYMIMAEGVKDNSGKISIEPINYGAGSSHKTYTSVEDLIEAIDPTGRYTFWILVCNENHVVIGDNTKRIHYADNMVFHESALSANDVLDDAIDDYMDHDHMFRAWRTGIMKMLEKHMPKYISRDAEYLRLKFTKTGITATIRTIDDSARYIKKVEAVLDAYASMLVVSKIILATIEKRYRGKVNETVGDSLVIDLYHDSDYSNESSRWMWHGLGPFNSTNRDIVIVEETSIGELPYANVLKSYAALIETMEFLGMPNTTKCPMHVGPTIAEDYYGGTDPFDAIYGSYDTSSMRESSESFSHSSSTKVINGVRVEDREKASYRKDNQKPVTVEINHLDEDAADLDTLNRENKADIADRYELRMVGNTHEQEEEDKAALSNYRQRKERQKKHREAEKKRKEQQRVMRAARFAKKRKAKLRKIKRFFGIKNEAVDSVDNADTETRETSEMREDNAAFGGDRKRYFDSKIQYADASESDDGPVIIEMVDRVRFNDRINEAAGSNTMLYPVYILLIHSGSTLANTINKAVHSEFSHVSISFDPTMEHLYSFGRKGKSIITGGGFIEDSINAEFYRGKDIPYALYMIPCTKSEVDAMKKRLTFFTKNHTKFRYDGAGLVKNYLGISDEPEYRYFCSRFVADILKAGRPDDEFLKNPSLVKPEDFKDYENAYFVEGGMLQNYDKAKTVVRVNAIMAKLKLRKKVNEGAVMNLHQSNPYQDLILEYQLTHLDEESFIAYLEKPKQLITVRGDKKDDPDYYEQNLEFDKKTRDKDFQKDEIEHYHSIVGEVEACNP